MSYYAGLDISMKETSIAMVNEKGKIVFETTCETEPEFIAKALNSFGFVLEKIGLESGCISFWLIEELKKFSLNAICIESKQMATIIALKVNKTDRNPATRSQETKNEKGVLSGIENPSKTVTISNLDENNQIQKIDTYVNKNFITWGVNYFSRFQETWNISQPYRKYLEELAEITSPSRGNAVTPTNHSNFDIQGLYISTQFTF